MPKTEQPKSEFLTIREADQIIKDFVYETKEIGKRTKMLRKAFMCESHIPNDYVEELSNLYAKNGMPHYACKIHALMDVIDQSLHERD